MTTQDGTLQQAFGGVSCQTKYFSACDQGRETNYVEIWPRYDAVLEEGLGSFTYLLGRGPATYLVYVIPADTPKILEFLPSSYYTAALDPPIAR